MIRVSDEVATALAEQRPVVALESTIFSQLGLPSPANQEALDRSIAAIRSQHAVPAVTAVLDGVARVGLEPDEHEHVLSADKKTASWDLPVAVGQAWPSGVTTVSAALALAEAAGITVFATGGIGGVHRGVTDSADISADLAALARYRVVCVSAGAKAFLDLPRTLEYLETLRVPVVGYRTDTFPAFYLRSSGLRVPHRIDHADDAARIFSSGPAVGHDGGLLVVAPIPEADALDGNEVWAAIDAAQAAADAEGITGASVTPFILERIGRVTEGRNLPANLSLAENNAAIAAEIAVALAPA